MAFYMIPNNHDDKLNIYVLSQNNIDYYNKILLLL